MFSTSGDNRRDAYQAGLGQVCKQANHTSPLTGFLMNFADIFVNLDREHLRLTMYGTKSADVQRALQNPAGNVEALMALLSPAAEPYLEQMAQQSMALTKQRFGHNISLFIPMYLSNLCANECDYCGFTMSIKSNEKY